MALKNLNKENNEKLRLKREGHALINQIKWKGYSKAYIYTLLSKELHIEERQAHFAHMNTLRELRPAVEALYLINKRLPPTPMAAGGRKKIVPIKSPTIIKVAAPKRVVVEQVKPKPKKVRRMEEHRRNTLPRADMLKVLAEMKRDHEHRPSVQMDHTVPEPTKRRSLLQFIASFFI